MESGKPIREIPAPAAAEWAGKGTMNLPLGSKIKRYKDFFEKAGQAYDIDPNLLAAMAYVESRGNPKAVSQAGARGLMQFMPDTARAMGLADVFDPAQSIMAAAKYMRQILDGNGGDLDMAIAGYNWGPARAGLKDGSGRGMPEETRKYLVEVKKYYSRQAAYYSLDVRINPSGYLGGYLKSPEQTAAYNVFAQGE